MIFIETKCLAIKICATLVVMFYVCLLCFLCYILYIEPATVE